MTRMGWDMDPFVVCSFGKKVFRTRVIRHSLNPVFEEKLLFPVRSYETSFRVQLSVHDWDKLSSNDHIGDTGFEVRFSNVFSLVLILINCMHQRSAKSLEKHRRRVKRRASTQSRKMGRMTWLNIV